MNAKQAKQIALTAAVDMILREIRAPSGITMSFVSNPEELAKVAKELRLIVESFEDRLRYSYGGRADIVEEHQL